MKTTPVFLLPPNLVNPRAFVSDTSTATLSLEKAAEFGFSKCNSVSNLRRCSSSMIITPVTPKPSQTQVTIVSNNTTDVKFQANARDAIFTDFQCRTCPAITDTVRGLQQSLRESKEYTETLEVQLRREKASQEILERDLRIMNNKYTSQIGRMDDISNEKSKLELELEDLTVTLFQQANEMVAQQKKISQALEADNLRLCKELSQTLQRLEDESTQLTELRDKLCKRDEDQKLSQLSSQSSATASSDDKCLEDTSTMKENLPRLNVPIPLQHPSINVNSTPYNEFLDFRAICKATAAKFHYSLPYIKRAQIEDVEPCLWFGDRAPVTSKKIVQAILKRSCFIEEYLCSAVERPTGSSWLSSRKWHMAGGCQLCCFGNSNVTFRFRLGEKCDWIYIDYACRQKLVAVCEFYAFIRNLLDGLYDSQPDHSLYNQNLGLKAKMFQARVGMNLQPTFEDNE